MKIQHFLRGGYGSSWGGTLGALGAEQTAWARSSIGETTVYPTLSGMVATPNSKGNWAAWRPQVGVRYDAQFLGQTITVENRGDGSYTLIHNGVTSRRDYSSRWEQSVFYDAAGNPISAPENANVSTPDLTVFMVPGPVMQEETGARPVTRSSDGRSDVWASDSGMAGLVNPSNAWVLWVPMKGIVIESNYGNRQIAIMNNGDGSYMLTTNGTTTKRAYAANWKPGEYYDARGTVVADWRAPKIEMNPVSAFFTPGNVAAQTNTTQTTQTTQTNTQPQVMTGGFTVAPTGGGSITTGVTSGGGGSFTSLSPVFPAPDDASWVTGTFPDESTPGTEPAPQSGGIDGKTVLALAALAFTFLN
jgi:hypothetical protein